MSPLLTLQLIRHGHTLWHSSGEIAGRSDVDLSVAGRQAVNDLATGLRPEQLAGLWHCSPLKRTRSTARLLCSQAERDMATAKLNNLQIDNRLRELDFGEWEGMTWNDVHTQYGAQLKHWSQDWLNHAPPGGESFAEQCRRCESWLNSCCDKTIQASGPNCHRNHVVVAHGGTIRALICLALGWPLSKAMDFRIDLASVSTLQMYEGEQRYLLRRLNATVS